MNKDVYIITPNLENLAIFVNYEPDKDKQKNNGRKILLHPAGRRLSDEDFSEIKKLNILTSFPDSLEKMERMLYPRIKDPNVILVLDLLIDNCDNDYQLLIKTILLGVDKLGEGITVLLAVDKKNYKKGFYQIYQDYFAEFDENNISIENVLMELATYNRISDKINFLD